MASSIRELILQQIVSLVDAATTTPVYRSRDAALASSQLPAIVITPIQDSPADERGSICWLDCIIFQVDELADAHCLWNHVERSLYFIFEGAIKWKKCPYRVM